MSLNERLRASGAWAFVLAGVVAGIPFLLPSAEPFGPLAFVPGFLLYEAGSRRPILHSWVAGTAYVAVGLPWLFRVSPAAPVVAALYFGLHAGLAMLFVHLLRHRAGLPLVLAAPLAIVAGEASTQHVSLWPVTWLFVGHLWWRFTSLMQVAEWGGVSLVSALVFLVAAAGVSAVRAVAGEAGERRSLRRVAVRDVAIAASALAVATTAGWLRLRQVDAAPAGAKLSVALVQEDVPQELRSLPENALRVEEAAAAATLAVPAGSVDLVAWPESTLADPPEDHPEQAARMDSLAAEEHSTILAGGLGQNPDASPPVPSNSAFLFDGSGRIAGRVDKRVLVPGAETLLVFDRIPFVRNRVSDFLSRKMHFRPYLKAGTRAVPVVAGGIPVGAMICYDDCLPLPADELREAGVEALVVISNEAWFGTRELTQHLAMATVRCIETRLPMARATNNGVTCVIDPCGRVQRAIPVDRPGVLVDTLHGRAVTPTPPWVRTAFQATISTLVLALCAVGLLRKA